MEVWSFFTLLVGILLSTVSAWERSLDLPALKGNWRALWITLGDFRLQGIGETNCWWRVQTSKPIIDPLLANQPHFPPDACFRPRLSAPLGLIAGRTNVFARQIQPIHVVNRLRFSLRQLRWNHVLVLAVVTLATLGKLNLSTLPALSYMSAWIVMQLLRWIMQLIRRLLWRLFQCLRFHSAEVRSLFWNFLANIRLI